MHFYHYDWNYSLRVENMEFHLAYLVKQGISLIPYDGLVLVISVAFFGIIYFRLAESLKAKKRDNNQEHSKKNRRRTPDLLTLS